MAKQAENGQVVLQNGELRVVIALRGAEMISVTDKNGKERLWNGDPAFWTSHAPVLFPYAGGLKDEYFTWQGKRYDNPIKHGFAKVTEFTLEESSGDEAVFLLNTPVPSYPFDYEFRVAYRLKKNTIEVTYDTKNVGKGEMYFGVGCHEAYATPGSIEAYRIVFEKEEEFLSNQLVGSQISHETKKMAPTGKVLPLCDEQFAVDAMVFLNIRSRAVLLQNDRGEDIVKVEFPGFDHMLVWKKPKAQYVCLEPWVNPPEWVDGGHDITQKPGIVKLESGEEKAYTHMISFL